MLMFSDLTMVPLILLVLVANAYGQLQQHCDRVCVSVYQPVCGSDRHTYSNMCTLQVAECKARLHHQRLTLLHTGACTSSNTHPPVVSHTMTCDAICDEEIHTAKICASNGVTYENQCEYNNARCIMMRNHTSLHVRHTGECTNVDAGCVNTCDLKEVAPVCSSANVTYLNLCMLKQMECRYAHIPTVASRYQMSHEGTCDGTDISHHIKYDCNPFINQAHVAVEGSLSTLFNHCPSTHDLVCGTDLRTYPDCYYCQMMAREGKLGADNTAEIISEGQCQFGTIG